MPIKIAGQVYEPVTSGSYTIDYDLYMVSLIRDTGINEILAAHAALVDPPENVRAHLADAVLVQIARSGKSGELIAGFVKPQDAPWSREWALDTAYHFNTTKAREDQKLLYELLLTGLADFFRLGTRFLETSLTSSVPSQN